MKQLAKGLYQLDLGKSNVFVLEGKDGLVLVDTAVVGVKDKLADLLEKTGFVLGDIKHILITHAHVDHVGGLREIQAVTGAEVWAHPLDAPFIVSGEHPPYPNKAQLSLFARAAGALIQRSVGTAQPSAPVHHEVSEGDVLSTVYEGLGVVHLPGHSPGQIGFWLPEGRILLGGDVMMHVMPWLHLPLGAYTPDMAEAKRSVIKAAALKPQTLGVGHGAPLVGNALSPMDKLASQCMKSLAKEQYQPVHRP